MPTYEYECKKCGHNFEAFQAMSDEPLKKCPKCGKELRRLIFGGTGIIFKGSGFYVTDKLSGKSALLGKGKSDSAESAPADTPDTSASTSTETPQPSVAETIVAGKAGKKKNTPAKSA